MKKIVLVLVLSCFCLAKDTVQVQVVAVHPVTHEDRGVRALVDKGLMGASGRTRHMDSFNSDAHVCVQPVIKACYNP